MNHLLWDGYFTELGSRFITDSLNLQFFKHSYFQKFLVPTLELNQDKTESLKSWCLSY